VKSPPDANLRALGLIHEAKQFADGLRLISLGLAALEIKHGGGITACAVEISKRLDALKNFLRRNAV
jgi:hypothetical protein